MHSNFHSNALRRLPTVPIMLLHSSHADDIEA